MSYSPENSRHVPQLAIDPDSITTHFDALLNTERCPLCAPVVLPAAADAIRLLAEVIRLHDKLIEVRLESANLRAAIRATLSAADDGEDDPLMFLRWEV